MQFEKINLKNKQAEGFVFDFGSVKMVFAKTSSGMIGCGLFNVKAFDNFNIPAALIKGQKGLITNIEELLNGTVKEVNETASNKGIIVGMNAQQALEMM